MIDNDMIEVRPHVYVRRSFFSYGPTQTIDEPRRQTRILAANGRSATDRYAGLVDDRPVFDRSRCGAEPDHFHGGKTQKSTKRPGFLLKYRTNGGIC